MNLTPAAALLCTVVAAAASFAQNAPPAPTTQDVPGLRRRAEEVPLLKSAVRLVTLDVVVTDKKGNTVHGLTASDFTVREGGAVQRVNAFDEHVRPDRDAAAAAEAAARLPPNTWSDAAPPVEESSAIVMVLDALDSPSVQDQMYLRQEMIKYMKTVEPGTRIAIVQLDTKLRMVQDFSSDPVDLMAGVKSKRNQPKLTPLPRPYFGGFAPLGIGGGADIAAVSNMNELDIGTKIAVQRRSQILGGVMPQLMNYVAAIPGRKSVVWFYSQQQPSGALSLSQNAALNTDQISFVDAISKTTEELKMSHIALYMVNIAGVGLDIANYAMEDAMRAQGGEAIYGTNDLSEVIEHVADHAWNFYTLSYTPTDSVFDGKFRRLEITVNQPGLELQYRRGYYAIDDSSKRARHQAALEAAQNNAPVAASISQGTIGSAMLMGAQAPRDVLFTAHVDPAANLQKLSDGGASAKNNYLSAKYRKGKYRAFTVSYTVDTKTLKFNHGFHDTQMGSLDLVAVVYDDQGMMVNSVISKASVHATPGLFARLQRDGVQVQQTIAIPEKGNFFLRLGVHDKTADKVGALEVPRDEIKLE